MHTLDRDCLILRIVVRGKCQSVSGNVEFVRCVCRGANIYLGLDGHGDGAGDGIIEPTKARVTREPDSPKQGMFIFM